MSLTKFTENTNVISELPDAPSMSAQEIKAKFDEAGTKIKNYINNTLTEETEQLVSGTKTSLQSLISALGTQIRSEITAGLQARYHVGKLIFETENVNPATYLGFGTWELWGKGRVPVGVDSEDADFNEAEKTGGEKTHTLTVAEMPRHKHGVVGNFDNTPGNQHLPQFVYKGGDWVDEDIYDAHKYTGKDQPHNNLQPYITCYMWKRVS